MPAPTTTRRRNEKLDVELPKVFRTQVLQVALELFRAHLVSRGRRIGAWRGVCLALFRRILEHEGRQERILREHWRRESQRDSDAVRGPRIDVDDLVVAVNLELCKIGSVLDLGDVN